MTQEISPFMMRSWELTTSASVEFFISKDEFVRSHKVFLDSYMNIPKVFYEFAEELVKKNLLRLPFDRILFEYAPYVVADSQLNSVVLCCKQHDENLIEIQPVLREKNGHWFVISKTPIQLKIKDNKTAQWQHPPEYDQNDTAQYLASSSVMICGAACAFMGSTSCFQQEIIIPEKLQTARARIGKPLYSFKILRLSLKPGKKSLIPIGTHRSPALHWRRGHYRMTYDKIVPVSPCLVGSIANGIADKAYEVVP